MTTPFDSTAASIPVTVIGSGDLPAPGPGVAVLILEPALHEHADGNNCPACLARGDIRALLFDMLTEARQGARPPFRAVIVDARGVDADPIIARLDKSAPATAFRDHTVMRSFHLSRVA